MNRDKPDEIEPLPIWVEEQLRNMPDPTESMLSKYDYLKDDLMAAVQKAADYRKGPRPSRKAKTPDVVLSIKGQLLEWAKGIELLLNPLAYAATRGIKGIRGSEKEAIQPVAQICKKIGKFYIEAATFRNGNITEIEINVLKSSNSEEVRPLKVLVKDEKDNLLEGPVQVSVTDQAPRFPGPSAGTYIFEVSWTGGSGKLRVKFK